MFDKNKVGPTFMKIGTSIKNRINDLESIYDKVKEEDKAKIDLELKLLNYGLIGENQIKYELENSFMDAIVLHDLYFEEYGLSAQIDYIVITPINIYVIECKNLYGDIEIDSNGNFSRIMNINNRKVKEGIYSPITQVTRHLELVKRMRYDAQNKVTQYLAKNNFGTAYMPVVVLSNPKTVLYSKYAKKKDKEMVIRADGLIRFMKEKNKISAKDVVYSRATMLEIANFFLEKNIYKSSDVLEKYEILEEEVEIIDDFDINDDDVVKKLKQYRFNKSKEERVKPYFIFNNKQMEDIIALRPKTKEELMTISGFKEVKTEKYGEDIIKIFN
ncbi:MAG: NERD domain-containing protein [Bacilli bacterium]|nr:NERD domain-containing protein [Bacilli bacterium]